MRRVRKTRSGRLVLRISLTVVGFAIIGLGVALIPLPGPGWVIVIAGMAVLALEYSWAHRLMTFTKRQVAAWLHWVGRQALWLRALIGLAGFVFISAVVWFSLKSTFNFDYIDWALGLLKLD